MNAETQTCQPDLLSAFLEGALAGREERRLFSHLDECECCRQQLDVLAAPSDSWDAAKAFLPDDDHDRLSVTILDGERQATPPQISQVLDVLQPTDDPAMLGRLGGYEVSGVVGAGGMGVVLKAFDRPLDRTVAIKVLAPHLATSGAARQRFSREARAAAAVLHPNVIAIHGVSTKAALPFLVMPYIGGASLQKRLDDQGPLPVADILRIGIQIAAGLAAAHEQGLVHRDIKPANILLDDGVDRLVITDFGLARAVDDASVTRTGVIAGTPQYMSPEQARGDSVDSRSDLFSLGSVMYALCTGRVPFRADHPYGVLRRISDHSPQPIQEINPDIPEWLCRAVSRLHAKSPNDRFASAHEVAEILTQCLAHMTQPKTNALPSVLTDSNRFSASRLWRTAFVALGLICFAVGVISFVSGLSTNPEVDNTSGETSSGVVATEGVNAKDVERSPFDTHNSDHGTGPFSSSAAYSGNEATAPEGTQKTSTDTWDDQLDPVLLHIERSLQLMQESDW